MLGHIYMLYNRVTGDSYVGKTIFPFEHRQAHWRYYLRGHGSARQLIVKAICDYGVSAFSVFCLESCVPEPLLGERERFFILQFGTKFPNGYNRTGGGAGLSGYKQSAASNAKRSAAMMGDRNPAKSSVSRAKNAEAHVGRKRSVESVERQRRTLLLPDNRAKAAERIKGDKNPMKRPEVVAKKSGDNHWKRKRRLEAEHLWTCHIAFCLFLMHDFNKTC